MDNPSSSFLASVANNTVILSNVVLAAGSTTIFQVPQNAVSIYIQNQTTLGTVGTLSGSIDGVNYTTIVTINSVTTTIVAHRYLYYKLVMGTFTRWVSITTTESPLGDASAALQSAGNATLATINSYERLKTGADGQVWNSSNGLQTSSGVLGMNNDSFLREVIIQNQAMAPMNIKLDAGCSGTNFDYTLSPCTVAANDGTGGVLHLYTFLDNKIITAFAQTGTLSYTVIWRISNT